MKVFSLFPRWADFAAALMLLAVLAADGQVSELEQMTERGQAMVGDQPTSYLIRRLPVSSFPELPAGIQTALEERGCMIPQTYAAHRPENVIHASLERSGSMDWAVLCSVRGTVSMLVFFSDAGEPFVLAIAPEKERLEVHGGDGALGFDWGIDAASPRQVHDAQAGLANRPAPVDHDALADERLGQKTVYHYFGKGLWALLEMPEE